MRWLVCLKIVQARISVQTEATVGALLSCCFFFLKSLRKSENKKTATSRKTEREKTSSYQPNSRKRIESKHFTPIGSHEIMRAEMKRTANMTESTEIKLRALWRSIWTPRLLIPITRLTASVRDAKNGEVGPARGLMFSVPIRTRMRSCFRRNM